jgi:hypothetical protein
MEIVRNLVELPDELLEEVSTRLCADLDGPASFGRFCCTCSRARRLGSDVALLGQRGLERGQSGVATLEQLAVLEALQNLGSARVVFLGADINIRPGSLARLDELAALMLRHPRLTVTVEAHTGRNAPDRFAPQFTCMRADAVAHRLIDRGVLDARITCNGWGKRIAMAAGWQPGVESAIAELFFHLDGLTLPMRPGYYSGVLPPEIGPGTTSDEDSDGSDLDQQMGINSYDIS